MKEKGRSGRTPQGVRGLKQRLVHVADAVVRRTPQGVRGLKPLKARSMRCPGKSHSARSAWIETGHPSQHHPAFLVALRKECVD